MSGRCVECTDFRRAVQERLRLRVPREPSEDTAGGISAQTNNHGREEGAILVLGLGYMLVALVLVVVVAVATSVHLERKRLLGFADQIALAAADAIDWSAYVTGKPLDRQVLLSEAEVKAVAADFVANASEVAGKFEALAVTASTDGVTVTVTLTSFARLPLLTPVLESFGSGITLRVSSTAQGFRDADTTGGP